MRTIPLPQGRAALVDDCDYEYLMQWKWQFHTRKSTGYANRLGCVGGKRRRIYMHRLVADRIGMNAQHRDVDHVDGNGLNNQRNNLRLATRSQNNVNSKRPKNNTSGFKGVYPHAQVNKWCAQIGVAGRRLYLGYFDDPREAASAYNEAALKRCGNSHVSIWCETSPLRLSHADLLPRMCGTVPATYKANKKVTCGQSASRHPPKELVRGQGRGFLCSRNDGHALALARPLWNGQPLAAHLRECFRARGPGRKACTGSTSATPTRPNGGTWVFWNGPAARDGAVAWRSKAGST